VRARVTLIPRDERLDTAIPRPELALFLVSQPVVARFGFGRLLAVLDHYGFDVLGARGKGDQIIVMTLHCGPELRGDQEQVSAVLPHIVVHSQSEDEAWAWVVADVPDLERPLRDDVLARQRRFQPDVPVLRHLRLGRRARVDLVHGPLGPVVRKTYADGYRRHLERELTVLQTVGGHLSTVPELLASGPNWFECPYYDDRIGDLGDVGRQGKLLPLGLVRAMVAALRQLYDRGFDLIDAKPHNFVLDPRHGLKLVDFEFAHRHDDPRADFAESWALLGPPDGFAGDVPVGNLSYERCWLPLTGLQAHELVHGEVWQQHVRRAEYKLRRHTTGPNAPARRALRRLRQ
jgi:hypothetical protein